MKLNGHKPSPRVEDRRHQKGSTTFSQHAGNLANQVKEGAKIESFATTARILLGYKEDPTAVRDRISKSLPEGPLRGTSKKNKAAR